MAPKPHELTDDVIAKLTDEQLLILQELGELAAKNLKVSRAIEEFSDRVTAAQRTMGFQAKDNPSVLHEDPEVIALVTIKARHKLGNIRAQIKRTLKRAAHVGLGDLALIQRQCAIYDIDCSADAAPPHRPFDVPMADTEKS